MNWATWEIRLNLEMGGFDDFMGVTWTGYVYIPLLENLCI